MAKVTVEISKEILNSLPAVARGINLTLRERLIICNAIYENELRKEIFQGNGKSNNVRGLFNSPNAGRN